MFTGSNSLKPFLCSLKFSFLLLKLQQYPDNIYLTTLSTTKKGHNMRQQLTRYTFLSTVFISILSSSSLLGLGVSDFTDFFDKMKTATQENYQELEKNICDKKKLCRQFNGEMCGVSKNFFDICWMVCKDFKGFKDSKCMGKVKGKFNKETGTWNKRKFQKNSADNCDLVTVEEEETPSQHLTRQIFKQRKSDGMFTGVFDSLCSFIDNGDSFVIKMIVAERDLGNMRLGCSKNIDCTD